MTVVQKKQVFRAEPSIAEHSFVVLKLNCHDSSPAISTKLKYSG